ncbi:MAG: hypothetical protein HS108_05935 [Planctomycetes bacterium]|jgi:hypothetical protein|nr:hypothetical protein [Planctomycetota bacterium]MCL4731228.1 hypothetical protein [Planctomycetota bacterium]
MPTLRELQSKAKKLLAAWRKEAADLLKKDRRSPVSHLCMSILMRNNSITNARQAEAALRKRFVDWNEIRVSPIAEVQAVLEECGTAGAEPKAYALRRFLRDVFSKYTKTNLYFDLMDIPEVVPVPLNPDGTPATPAASSSSGDDDDEEEEAVSRESGLPPHPSIPGFVDMNKIIEQPVPLDPKLITEKNGIHVAGIAWDDAERGPFGALWRVALVSGLVEPQLSATGALGKLRTVAPEKERDQFAYFAILHAQQNWPAISSKSDQMRAKYKKKDEDEEEVPEEAKRQKAKAGK